MCLLRRYTCGSGCLGWVRLTLGPCPACLPPGQSPAHERDCRSPSGDNYRASAQMTRLLDSRVPIDGVFCFNDTLAFGALHILASRGIRVPEDIVVGFDNVTGSAYSNPSLTTIDPGCRQIAETAIDLLAQRIQDGPAEHPTEAVTDYSLVVRRSA
ncbi:substrate-binding domain-containing protein [Nonomuraea sp. 3N208]|uniref:substrate-binding domain-containing protein n=1 Tax=Nonomuraea sp. 3N208 TaxID=3457421 RepID=UPI003FD18555